MNASPVAPLLLYSLGPPLVPTAHPTRRLSRFRRLDGGVVHRLLLADQARCVVSTPPYLSLFCLGPVID